MTTNSENYIDLAKRLYTESKAKLNHKRAQCKQLVAQNQVLKIALVSLVLLLITIIVGIQMWNLINALGSKKKFVK